MHLTALNALQKQNGFILLEVLLAMSLILGVWMTSIGVYQRLAFQLSKQEGKRSQLRQVFDSYEIAEQVRANEKQAHFLNPSNTFSKSARNESSRMSGRNRTLRFTTEPTFKVKR